MMKDALILKTMDIRHGDNRIGSFVVSLQLCTNTKHKLVIISSEYVDPLRWTEETLASINGFLNSLNISLLDCDVYLDKSKITSHNEEFLFKWQFSFIGHELVGDVLLPVCVDQVQTFN